MDKYLIHHLVKMRPGVTHGRSLDGARTYCGMVLVRFLTCEVYGPRVTCKSCLGTIEYKAIQAEEALAMEVDPAEHYTHFALEAEATAECGAYSGTFTDNLAMVTCRDCLDRFKHVSR